MPYGGGYSDLSSENNRLNQYNFIKNSKKGAILIEFAFAVPVLFSLIYYIQDLATIKRWHSKLDFSLHCAANMFQNTQSITGKDVVNVHHACRLSCFPDGIKSFEEWSSHSYTLFQLGVLCVVGTDTNRCKVQWFAWSQGDDFTYRNQNNRPVSNTVGWNPFVSLTIGNEYNSSTVYPSLTISAGETKILLVHVFCCQFAGLQDSWPKSILGLHIALPVVYKYNDFTKVYLRSIVIFTPKPGTFDPNKPPQ